MKKSIYLLTIIFSLIFITSCNNNKKQVQAETINSEGSLKYKFEIYDSIDLADAKKIKITDYNRGENSFIGIFDKDIVGFNNKEELFRISSYGNGPADYTYRRPYHSNVKYLNDSVVMINSYNYLKYYTLNGQLIKSLKIDEGLFYLDRKILGYNSRLNSLVFEGDNSDIEDEEVNLDDLKLPFDRHHFFIWNSDQLSGKCYATLEKENRIIKENRSFWGYNPILGYNHNKEYVGVLYSADHSLYTYSLDNPNKYEILELQPEYFPEVLLYEDYKGDPEQQREEKRKDILSSHYKRLYYSEDTVITVYRPGVDSKAVDSYGDKIFDYKQFYIFALENYKNVFEYYINGKKVMHDIMLPDSYEVCFIGNSQKIVCQNNAQELMSNGKSIQRFYLGRLVAIKDKV